MFLHITLHYISTTLHYITLHYITLHYITLHSLHTYDDNRDQRRGIYLLENKSVLK